MSSSFIPPICMSCGGMLSRISNVEYNLKCTSCHKVHNIIPEEVQ